ncbi:unnamed protein product [Tilletia controversa]|uniref:Allantoicase domain-containing protein n=3 Tax=Tilletia TaxID=13289 RepID=A0A8X7N210_9BASI|nr:hypothetical protein CF328_g4522 [Tilletia controversa]KAE8199731.1 hypothetical protein CF335_g4101 [Tilletia laevis]KAE8259036.1 hypothetical protein A4X03_0g4212 [Tilletia caries]KAE8201606.1 hypothetical protein CF336_g109 [Tilletia laevis]KAE8255942.1 hypothetical protein A4X06_0g178 [Tilletia controversa]
MSNPSSFQLEPISLTEAPTRLYAQSSEVSSAALGAHILSTSDEWFAPASDLLKVGPAPSLKGTFGPKGALFDGWETRRHNPLPQKYDWVILRLGPTPGAHLTGLDLDTANFNGNEAPEVEVHALRVDPAEEVDGPTFALAEHDPRWTVLLPRTPCGPSQQHLYASTAPTEQAYTHIKLLMVPDGGIARFRVYGTIPPPPPSLGIGELIPTPGGENHLNTLDLAHVLNGGRVIFTSDQHFGVGSNLILPGRGKDMGDGWETKRSRHPEHKDWVIIRLAQRAYLTSAEIDTIHFLGNFPDSVELHALDLSPSSVTLDMAKLADSDERVAGWTSILPPSKVGPGKQHVFDLQSAHTPHAATHVRVTMHPDGGIKRVRLVGRRANEVDAFLSTSTSPSKTQQLPPAPLPSPAQSSSFAPTGLYPLPTSYPVTGSSIFDSELRDLLLSTSDSSPDHHGATIAEARSLEHDPSVRVPPQLCTAGRIRIPIEPLTREAYAPYGSLIDGPLPSSSSENIKSKTVNQGTASKYLSLSPFLSTYPTHASASAQIHVFRCAPRFSLPSQQEQGEGFEVKVLERHRFTTQVFVPLTSNPRTQQGYLVIVALPSPDEGPADLSTLRAFLASSTQAISYHPGVWHHPMVALGTAHTDFACFVHESAVEPGLDCDEIFYGEEDEGRRPLVVL